MICVPAEPERLTPARATRATPAPTLSVAGPWALADGSPVFFAVACDLDHPLVRGLGATLIRYPVRRARFEFSESSFRASAADGTLHLVTQPIEGSATPVVREPLPVFSSQGDALFRIPWDENPTTQRSEVRLEVRDDSLASRTMHGTLRWPERATVMRGRRHHCGFASRVR